MFCHYSQERPQFKPPLIEWYPLPKTIASLRDDTTAERYQGRGNLTYLKSARGARSVSGVQTVSLLCTPSKQAEDG